MSEKYQPVVDAVYFGVAKILSGSSQLFASEDVKEVFRILLIDSELSGKINFNIYGSNDSKKDLIYSIEASPSFIRFFSLFGVKNSKRYIDIPFSDLLENPKASISTVKSSPSLKNIDFSSYEDIVLALYQTHAKKKNKSGLKINFKSSYDIEVSSRRLEEMKKFYEHYEAVRGSIVSSFSKIVENCEELHSDGQTFFINWLSGSNNRPAIIGDITDALNGKIRKLDSNLWDSLKLRFIREEPLVESTLLDLDGINSDGDKMVNSDLSMVSNHSSGSIFKIFYGPPGTGKTREARRRVGENKERYKIVQIHPSSSYEDLIEGIKPVTFPNGDVKYEVQDGPIKIMAKKASKTWAKSIASARYFHDEKSSFLLINFPMGTMAKWFLPEEKFSCRILAGADIGSDLAAKSDTIKIDITSENQDQWKNLGFTFDPERDLEELFVQLEFKGSNWGGGNYVLVLDELNRGNVSSILGELVFAISENRGTHSDKKAVSLQYSHEQFIWPSGLSLYGTMNSTDISLDRIDQAIKRRFDFQVIEPDPTLLKIDGLTDRGLNTYLQELNLALENAGAENGAYNVKDKLIGHSYFLPLYETVKGRAQDEQLKTLIGTELKKIWDGQILQSLLSVFNGSRDDLDKSIDGKLKQFAPNAESKTIYGWPFSEPTETGVVKRVG